MSPARMGTTLFTAIAIKLADTSTSMTPDSANRTDNISSRNGRIKSAAQPRCCHGLPHAHRGGGKNPTVSGQSSVHRPSEYCY